MDASSRAELETLRRRAYGPDADIDDDPAALARLDELEKRVREEHLVLAGVSEQLDATSPAAAAGAAAAAAGGHTGGAGIPADDDGSRDAAPAAPETDQAARPSRRRRVGLIGLAAGLVVIVAGAVVVTRLLAPGATEAAQDPMQAREAYTLARDADAAVLLRIPIRASFDDGVDLPAGPLPPFPSSGEIEWAEPLGEYYGWNVWIAGADGAVQREHCLLAERAGTTRARCVPAVLRPQSALAVTLPYRLIPREERPDELARNERIGFWWNEDGEVTVLLAVEPPTA